MFNAPYDRHRSFDIVYEKIILGIKKALVEKDDDAIILYAGPTGTGKSNLMLWGYQTFDPDGCSQDFIGLDRQTHAIALKKASEKDHPRFCGDDEANVSKRDAMTKYNRNRIDLYFAIRGLNIFHGWCNPSVEMLDKVFIEERIKGMIFVLTKDVDRPRIYYYFTKKGLLKMLEEYGNLKEKTIRDYGEKYAMYKGWFRKYEGPLLEAYLKKKDDRMSTKVTEFFETYGEAWMNKTTVAKKLKCDARTIDARHERLVEFNYLKEDSHYRINPTTEIIEWNESALVFLQNKKLYVSLNSNNATNINNHAFDTQNKKIDMED